jgi:hypothetical protein
MKLKNKRTITLLFLAYGLVANATSGGFFPNGSNGNLHTSTASA